MDKLVVDFPKARIVFQNYPIAAIHPEAVNGSRIRRLRGQAGRQQRVLPVRRGGL